MMIYRVREGDSVASVAREHGVLPTRLCELNALSPDAPLAVGEALLIPSPSETARIREGDTLATLATRHRTSRSRLLRENPSLAEEGGLSPGRSISLGERPGCRDAVTVLGYARADCPREALAPALPYLTYLAVLTAAVGEGGLILPDDAEIVAMAREAGATPILVLSVAGDGGREGEERRTEALLLDGAAQAALTEALAAHMRERGYGGVLLDLPFVTERTREAYRTMVMALRRRFGHRAAVLCTLTPEGGAGQDASLLRAVGGAVLSAYGYGGRYGSPSPEAPLECVEEALSALARVGRPQKLMLGISTRAVDFPVGGGVAEVYPAAEVPRVAREARAEIAVDEAGRVPYLAYRREGGERIAFFEDAGSIDEKLTLCERLGVGGIALFPCEGVTRSVLSLIAERFGIVRPYGE